MSGGAHPQLGTTVPRTTVRSPRKLNHCLSLTSDQYNILTPRLCGLMVRRWRLIGHFPILYYPQLGMSLRGHPTSSVSQLHSSLLQVAHVHADTRRQDRTFRAWKRHTEVMLVREKGGGRTWPQLCTPERARDYSGRCRRLARHWGTGSAIHLTRHPS
jgi:hypothetical protein